MGTLYVGSNSGGVWRTTNGGQTWISLTEDINNLNVGALALAPSSPDTVYLGTGSEHAGGIGLLKSTDGGATWAFPASVVATRFFRILVHPTNSQDLVIGTSSGALRSTDGGSSWATGISNQNVTDLVRHPTNPLIVYAASYSYSTGAVTISKSSNGGTSWSPSSVGLPVPGPGQNQSVPAIAISQSNPLILYLSFSLNTSGIAVSHVYKSTNGGDSWTDLPAVSGNPSNNFLQYQAWHDNAIAVSPVDPNTVIAAGVYYIRSLDGGQTWVSFPYQGSDYPHADVTDMRFQGTTLYTASDGGIWSMPNYGTTNTATALNNTLVTREYYAMSDDPINRNRLYVGAQDNGTERRPDEGGSQWIPVFGGDGFQCPINPSAPEIAYLSYQYGQVLRTKQAGMLAENQIAATTFDITPPYPSTEPRPFGTSVVIDPTATSTIYTATNRLWRSTDGGDAWAPVPTTTTDGSIWSTSYISAVAVAPTASSTLLVGGRDQSQSDSVVFRSTNGGVSWKRSADLPSVNALEFDPLNANVAYAAVVNYSGQGVYWTTDGGATWAPRGTGLPQFPGQVVRVDPSSSSILYCGTDAGVYRSTDQGVTWALYGTGLPSVSVYDLRVLPDGSAIRCITYGRGVWEIQTPIANTPPVASIAGPSTIRVLKGTAVSLQGSISDPDSGDTPTGLWTFTDTGETFAGNASSSIAYQFDRPGTFPVTLVATDTFGTKTSASVTVSVYEPFDNCSSPAIIPGNGPFPFSIATNNEAGSIQPSDPQDCAPVSTYWFEFTPASTGTYAFSTSKGLYNINMAVAVYSGPACGPYTLIGTSCNYDAVSVSGQAGVTLRVVVRTFFAGRNFTLTVSQPSDPCTFSLSSSSLFMSYNGGASDIDVATPGGCPWTAVSNSPSFISVLSGASGSGNGRVRYSVAANSGGARSGTLTIAGISYTINQAAAGCSYALDPPSTLLGGEGGTGNVVVNSASGCAWTAVSNAPWIVVTGSPGGTGNGTVSYSVNANSAHSRAGTITVGGEVFRISQSGGCSSGQTGIAAGQTIEGNLTTSDCLGPVRTTSYHDRFTFTGAVGRTYYIEMGSAAFDTYLVLKGPGGTVVAEDDNTAGGTNARIRYTASAAGTYTVEATSAAAAATGSYSIRLAQRRVRTSTTGVFRPSNAILYLKNQNTSGFADIFIPGYGLAGDKAVVGDWNGDGVDTIGVFRSGTFFLRNSNNSGFGDITVTYGQAGDLPVVGDWDGDGIDTVGFYRGGAFYLRNTNTTGDPQLVFSLGNPGDVPIAGDWNRDGVDTVGVFRPSNAILYLKNTNVEGFADVFIPGYGIAGDAPVTGDWNGDGTDTIGVYRGGTFYLRNTNDSGFADLTFALGIPGDAPLAGDWDGFP
jgi:photosystem II stability/assembly factor-like uncharacterized protein